MMKAQCVKYNYGRYILSSARVNVTIPEKLKIFIQDRVNTGEYSTPSDYVRTLIREDQRRIIERVNSLIQEGLNSGISKHSPAEIFAAARADIDETEKKNKK